MGGTMAEINVKDVKKGQLFTYNERLFQRVEILFLPDGMYDGKVFATNLSKHRVYIFTDEEVYIE
jgi:hypothetical protein